MSVNKRIGSCVPIENVDPHTGPFLDYGIICGWQDENGKPCQRRDAKYAIVEPSGRKFADWNQWSEDNAWRLCPFID